MGKNFADSWTLTLFPDLLSQFTGLEVLFFFFLSSLIKGEARSLRKDLTAMLSQMYTANLLPNVPQTEAYGHLLGGHDQGKENIWNLLRVLRFQLWIDANYWTVCHCGSSPECGLRESGNKLGLGLSSFQWELGPILAASPHILFLTQDPWRESSHYRKGQVVSPGTVPLSPFTSTAKKVNQSNTKFLGQLKR